MSTFERKAGQQDDEWPSLPRSDADAAWMPRAAVTAPQWKLQLARLVIRRICWFMTV